MLRDPNYYLEKANFFFNLSETLYPFTGPPYPPVICSYEYKEQVAKPKCETTCQPKCETTCQPKCETTCNPCECETTCNSCQPKCETTCNPCECETTCNSCQPKCETATCECQQATKVVVKEVCEPVVPLPPPPRVRVIPRMGRFFDPWRRHWYSIDKLFMYENGAPLPPCSPLFYDREFGFYQ